MEVENFGINPYGDSNKKLSVSYSYSYIHVWLENMGSGLRAAVRYTDINTNDSKPNDIKPTLN